MIETRFYEVMDSRGDFIWGGENAREAVTWYRRTPNAGLFVSVWNTTSEDDFRLISDRIEVTPLILATILSEKERV